MNNEPVAQLKQYMKNSVLHDFAPEIANALDKLRYKLDLKDPLSLIKGMIKRPTDVLNYSGVVAMLNYEERENLSLYLLEMEAG